MQTDNPLYKELDRLYKQNQELKKRLGRMVRENRNMFEALEFIEKTAKYNRPKKNIFPARSSISTSGNNKH
jgi:SMC interacting uncharacterized protein involved in chromosome segregation